MLKQTYLRVILVSVLPLNCAFANYASTDYVKASIQALLGEFNAKITETNTHTTTGMERLQERIERLPIITHHIGERFQGGIIFYVDASRQHGLMAALADLGEEGIEWRNGDSGDKTVNAQAQGLGSGEANTRLIIAEQTIDEQDGQFAALLAANYQITADGTTPCAPSMTASALCYGGWYLPSAVELGLLYTNLKTKGLGNLSETAYWSSTEASTTTAWRIDFSNG